MIIIEKVKTSIIVKPGGEEEFGFDINLSYGLNIVTGENSSGKSSILSCIYYCLGMEQLLGGIKPDVLDKCLREQFQYDSNTYNVVKSYAELHIENGNKEKVKLQRIITSPYNERTDNIIIINSAGKEETKFLHSVGDSDDEAGFYTWLAKFSDIRIPYYIDENGKESKILYLQHIFSSAFIEQTKGWSDFFAQLPYFNTKKPKQKIVEYLFDLNSLAGEFALDILKAQEKEKRINWTSLIENFKTIASHYNFSVYGLKETFSFSISPKKIKNLPLITKVREEQKSIKDILLNYQTRLTELQISNDLEPEPGTTIELQEKQKSLIEEIDKINKQLIVLNNKKANEEEKKTNYNEIIKQLNREINSLSSLKKIDDLSNLANLEVSNCPVCNSALDMEGDSSLKNIDKVDSSHSIAFYKSEKALYEAYLENLPPLLDKFDSLILFYKEQLEFNTIKLQEINKEIISDKRIPSRAKISEEVNLRFEISRLESLEIEFIHLKEKLISLANDLLIIKVKKEEMKNIEEIDNSKISILQSTFLKLLEEFKYTSNKTFAIKINNEDPYRLFPKVYYRDSVPQSIRLSSSASDFIRAMWAFYLTLLTKSLNHPGFIVFDEPGQHAMSLESMKALVKAASKLKSKQVILAISKDKYKSQKAGESFELSDILFELTLDTDYKMYVIKDNERGDKCVQPISQN